MRLSRCIILEGPDGGGKTALYTKMVHSWGLRGAGHDGGPPTNAAEAWKRLALFSAKAPAIRDRTPAISDIIYSRVLNRPTMVSLEEYMNWLWLLEPVVVYVRPPDATLLEIALEVRPHKTEEFVGKLAVHRQDIVDEYDRFFAELRNYHDVFEYDRTKDAEASILQNQLLTRDIICAD